MVLEYYPTRRDRQPPWTLSVQVDNHPVLARRAQLRISELTTYFQALPMTKWLGRFDR